LSEMRPKCGPFQQFGPHADQVRNCGLLRKHCTFRRVFSTQPYQEEITKVDGTENILLKAQISKDSRQPSSLK